MKQENKKKFLFLKISIVSIIVIFLVLVTIPALKYLREKAYETAYLKEKTEHMNIYALKELKNPDYLTWEEFESLLIEALKKTEKQELKGAINIVLEEYINKINKELTDLTKEQIFKIFEYEIKENNINLLTEEEIKELIVHAANLEITVEIKENLEFKLNDDGMTYSVIGIGNYKGNEIKIPNKYNDLPVTNIKSYAFYKNTSITSIVIPSSIESIAECAFAESNLENIIFEKTIASVWSG